MHIDFEKPSETRENRDDEKRLDSRRAERAADARRSGFAAAMQRAAQQGATPMRSGLGMASSSLDRQQHAPRGGLPSRGSTPIGRSMAPSTRHGGHQQPSQFGQQGPLRFQSGLGGPVGWAGLAGFAQEAALPRTSQARGTTPLSADLVGSLHLPGQQASSSGRSMRTSAPGDTLHTDDAGLSSEGTTGAASLVDPGRFSAPAAPVERVVVPPPVMRQIIEYATISRNAGGSFVFDLRVARAVLGGARIQVVRRAYQQVALRIQDQGGVLSRDDIDGLVESIERQGIRVVHVKRVSGFLEDEGS